MTNSANLPRTPNKWNIPQTYAIVEFQQGLISIHSSFNISSVVDAGNDENNNPIGHFNMTVPLETIPPIENGHSNIIKTEGSIFFDPTLPHIAGRQTHAIINTVNGNVVATGRFLANGVFECALAEVDDNHVTVDVPATGTLA